MPGQGREETPGPLFTHKESPMAETATNLREKATNAVIGTLAGLILAVGSWVTNKVSDHVGEISSLKTRMQAVEHSFDRIEEKLDRVLKVKP